MVYISRVEFFNLENSYGLPNSKNMSILSDQFKTLVTDSGLTACDEYNEEGETIASGYRISNGNIMLYQELLRV